MRKNLTPFPSLSTGGSELAETTPLADDVIYLAAPEPFGNAAVWFKDFGRPKDEVISELLNEISISSVGP
jgi:predicted phosphoribosyltransferase